MIMEDLITGGSFVEPIVLSKKQRQALHNAYCPTVEQTIAICEVELKQQDKGQINYLEVPFEQFEQILVHFNQTNNIKQGAFTYQQVRHIAEAGNVHHLTMDAQGMIYFTEETIGMSTALSFAQSKWNGAERAEAVENAVFTGLMIVGELFAQQVIKQQIQLVDFIDDMELDVEIVEAIQKSGDKVVIQKMAGSATKKAKYSSIATKKAFTLSNGNVVTSAIVTDVMSNVDIIQTIKGHLSPAQLFKHVSKTATGMIGSIAGFVIGGGIGFTIPSVSTAVISLIGGIIGLILGSVVTTKLVKKGLDFIIKDDAVYMLEIFNEALVDLAQQYLLNERELQQVLNDFNEIYNMRQELRNMFASDNREAFAREMIEKELDRIVRQRMYLQVPTNQELYEMIVRLV